MPQFDAVRDQDAGDPAARRPQARLRAGRRRSACRRRPARGASTRCRRPASSRDFRPVIGRRAVGLMVEVFIQVRLVSHSDDSPEKFIAAVERMDEVSACWTMTGELRLPAARDGADGRRPQRLRHAPADALARRARRAHAARAAEHQGSGPRAARASEAVNGAAGFLLKACTQNAEQGQIAG